MCMGAGHPHGRSPGWFAELTNEAFYPPAGDDIIHRRMGSEAVCSHTILHHLPPLITDKWKGAVHERHIALA